MNAFGHALRALRRDLRAREPIILAAAIVVAVGAVSAVGFFVDRVEQGMERQASDLLAADLVLESGREIPRAYADNAASRGLSTTTTVTFPTVIVAGNRTELVSAKAVGDGYPLRGEARIGESPAGPGHKAETPPAAGTVWLDPRLFTRLDTTVEGLLPVGRAELEVGAALLYEPDRTGSLFELAPRIMFHRSDLADTELITEDSRATYALLIAGDGAGVAAFRSWAESRIGENIQIRDSGDARPAMRTALERATSFLGLAAMMAVLLAGAAVAVAIHALGAREADVSALMRCFGARQRLVVSTLLYRLLIVGLAASVIGIALGWLAQTGLVAVIGDWFGRDLPGAGPEPAMIGLLTGVVTLVGFGLVPALRIRRVPVSRVLRHERTLPEPSAVATGGLAMAAVAGLLLYQAGDLRLGGIIVAGLAGMLALLGTAAWLLIRVAGRLRGQGVSTWRFGLAGIARRPRASTVQSVGFGLGLLALLLLGVVRVDVLDAWERQIPADAPNQFMVNIQAGDVDAVRERLQGAGAETDRFYPLVRGRLTQIDGRAVSPEDYDSQRARRLVEREFNLSWLASAPPDNEVVAGSWWNPATSTPQWSVEVDVAEHLGIAMGDRLTFRIGGEEATGRVTNLRTVNWESFRPNFFVLANPEFLGNHSATYMTAYRLPAEGGERVAGIARDFPGITVLDVGALIERVRAVIDQGSRAVEYVFLFTLAAGVIVLIAAVNASREERRTEIALLRTLGARQGRIRRILVAEFGALGAVAGGIAAVGAGAIGWAVSTQIFELPYALDPLVIVVGVAGGATGIALAGLATTWRLVNERPSRVLQGG